MNAYVIDLQAESTATADPHYILPQHPWWLAVLIGSI
jgi:hypothetical protein